ANSADSWFHSKSASGCFTYSVSSILSFDERQFDQFRPSQFRVALLQRKFGPGRQVITAHIAERDETIQSEAVRAAGDLSDLLTVIGEDFRAGRGKLPGFDQQSAQTLRRLAAPMDSRDDFLAQITPLVIADRRFQLGFEDDVIFAGVNAFARDARFDARDLERP